MERLSRRSSWHMASVAGLLLALGAGGCKDDNAGRGPVDDRDGSTEEEDGGDNGPDATRPDGGGDTPDGGDKPDGGGEIDGSTDGAVDQDTSTPGGDGGNDAGPTGPTIVDKTSIDFGLSNCGGDAPASQTFKLTNTGTAPVTYSVALSNSNAFSIQGATGGSQSGTVAAGAEVVITLNAVAVPSGATAGQKITATATITTNLPAPNNSFVVPISVTPQGAHLALGATGAPEWLLVQAGQTAAPKNVTLVNTGNVAAAVTLTQPAESAFSVNRDNVEAGSFTVDAASAGGPGSVTLSAGFAPTVIRAYTDGAALAVAGAVCNGGQAASLTSIPLKGAATGEGLSLDITDIFENRVNCGATGAQVPKATIEVTNNSTNNLLVAVSTIAGSASSPFTLSKNTLNLPSGGSDSFDVTVLESFVARSVRPGTEVQDTLLITPQGTGVNPIIYPLSTVVQGALLTIAGPTAFENATYVNPVTNGVTVSNTGNLPASPVFTIVDPSNPAEAIFSVALSPSQIPAGSTATPGTADVEVTFKPPVGDVNPKTASLALAAGTGDVICDPAPANGALTGTASTSGWSLISAAPVFEPLCPAAGASDGTPFGGGNLPVRFQNNGNQPLKWTAAVDNPALFAMDIGGTPVGTDQYDLAAGAAVEINVAATPLTFPAVTTDDNYGANLVITTDVPGDAPHTIRLKQTAQGSIVALSGAPLAAFADVNVLSESSDQTLFSLLNTGNRAVDVTTSSVVTAPTAANAAYYFGSVNYASIGMTGTNVLTLPTNSDTPVALNATFDPVFPLGDAMAYNENTDLVTSTLTTSLNVPGPVCQPVPAAIVVTGRGTNAVSAVSATSVDFSASPSDRQVCGGVRAAKPKTIVVTNYGNQPLSIDSATTDNAAFFDVYVNSPGQGTAVVEPINMETGTPGSAVVVVLPKLIPGNVSRTETATLTIATSIAMQPAPSQLPTIALSNTIVCP